MEPLAGPGLTPLTLARAPEPDVAAVPSGFVVLSDDETRIHFLDWGGPAGAPGVLLVPGLANTAATWAAVARRLRRVARVAVMDLRGHGLSDAPTEGYDPDTLAGDAIAAAEGSGVLREEAPFVIAGHGFGGVVAAWAANALGARCAGLVLVDGGWASMATETDATPEEWLAAIEEPPAVLASMDAWLADRRAFDPSSWDGDAEAAVRAQVVETAAGRVKLAVHPHALAGSVRALFAFEPAAVLPTVEGTVAALVAGEGSGGAGGLAALRSVAERRVRTGRGPIAAASFPGRGHNLLRYEAAAVAAAIDTVASGAG